MTTARHPIELPPPRYTLRVIPRHRSAPLALRLRSFALEEQLHAPYELAISAVLLHGSDPSALRDAHVELGIHRGDALRVVYGLVYSSHVTCESGGEPIVHLHIGPALTHLGVCPRFRIFQGCSVVDVVRAVLEQPLLVYGSAVDVSRLRSSYPPLEQCVQYRETDLSFVLRILAEAGITLLMHHGHGSEIVVLVDDNEALPLGSDDQLDPREDARIPWFPIVQQRAHDPRVESISLVHLTRDGTHVELRAASDATMLRAGSVLELEEPPSDDHDETWVVTRIRHTGQGLANDEPDYRNELECRPWRLPLAPPRPLRPQAFDTQHAIVVGPTGGPASTDPLGRIHVRMLWNEPGHGIGADTCWIPVAQPSRGALPRAGSKVLVSFIDGNPDRPSWTATSSDLAPPAPREATDVRLRFDALTPAHHGEIARR